MKSIVLKIEGMSCSACQNTLEKYLNKQDGVVASVNLVMASATISYDENKVEIDDLNRYVKEAGYKSLGIYKAENESISDSKYVLIVYGVLLCIMMGISMFFNKEGAPFAYGISLFILSLLFLLLGKEILISGIKKILTSHPNMDSLVSIGVLASFSYSLLQLILTFKGDNKSITNLYFESSAMILYFVKLGKYLEHQSQKKARSALKELVQITPESALLKKGNKEIEVTIDEVKKKDILICKPGMKVAVDGIIIKGGAHFDESFITGESTAKKKSVGENILAGSFNLDGYIQYQAQRIGAFSTVSEMVRRVLEASNSKVKLSRLADKVSLYFVPTIFLLAFLSLAIHLLLGHSLLLSFTSFVSILVISCPCALGLATPMAIVVSVGILANKGILIKNSEVLERISEVDTIVFDKTGTLTYGDLRTSKIINYSSYKDDDILNKIANLEKNSSHPIAKAFSPYLKKSLDVKNFETFPGLGIVGDVDKKRLVVGNKKILKKYSIEYESKEKFQNESVVYVALENKIVALVLLSDKLRKNSKSVVSKLKRRGLDLLILSGDEKNAVALCAGVLGIKNYKAELLPSQKDDVITSLKNKGHVVMMVGDGINDALSLVRSDVSVSLSSGCDIAGDCSDVLLMKDDLAKIIDLLEVSKRTIRVIKENLIWAFFYNICMIPMAMGFIKGVHITPMFASMAMTCSSLFVVLNSLRIRKKKENA